MKASAVSNWYKVIGARGGRAGKGTALRRELNRRAARIRWAKRKAQATR